MTDDLRELPLVAPAITAIKNEDAAQNPQSRGHMERSNSSTSAYMRAEGDDLRSAVEQSLNVILELTLDGRASWASPAWHDVVGIPFEEVQGKPIADILVDNSSVFTDAIEEMQKDDSGSKNIRFSVRVRSSSNSAAPSAEEPPDVAGVEDGSDDNGLDTIDLEGQGILVSNRSPDEESRTMWMIKPVVVREITIDLPNILIESLGVGADLLAQYLTTLADSGVRDPENHPPPLPVLCRICERQITPWILPKHSELCLQEHRAEAELEMAQDTLTDQRKLLVSVLDSLEAQMRYRAQRLNEGEHVQPSAAEYKGMEIGTTSSPSSGHSSGVASPAGLRSDSRDRSTSVLSHSRGRSFAVRRPLARIVELVLDLCDTALEISTPALKEGKGLEEEIRTQSPQSEGRISQVLQWQSPSQGALEHEAGLIALCDDTNRLSRAKVESVLLYRRILEYSQRIRSELLDLVQECIDAALQKAARIAAGDISSSSDSESTGRAEQTDDDLQAADVTPQGDIRPYPPGFDGLSAMTTALRRSSQQNSPSPPGSPLRPVSSSISTRSSSPKGCTTPRSYSGSNPQGPQAHRASITTDTDAGGDSDVSAASSMLSRARRAASPSSEVSLSRTGTRHSRDRKRSSLVLSRALSSSRQESPGRSSGPASPLRVSKPRLPSTHGPEDSRSPIISPTLSSSEFVSPVIAAQSLNHRRQSSAASSEISRAAVSPRLSMSSHLPPRAVPPSIRDFEIIKPISKGAFGSVYLAKKKVTGDYYAIKALKKTDMVAKNQVANVKAERAILMWQGESDFVAKLYWTFPSKDYIFLVMEYLNGGDCASLVQALGTLPEDWAKRYMAEVVQGVEHLHSREIVHRDLKPDNLLIDQKGHLKLTDFGLSRMGLIGRQKRALSKTNSTAPDPLKQGPFQRSPSMTSSRSTSFDVQGHHSPGLTPSMTPVIPSEAGQPSYFSLSRESSLQKDAPSRDPMRTSSGHQSDIIDTEQLTSAFRRFSLYDESWSGPKGSPKDEEDSVDGYPLQSITSNSSNPKASTPPQSSANAMPPPPMALFDPEDSNRRFVGTPDYLAPETINGLGQDEMSDWWSMGCILFEFIFGYPPFHADKPDKVFDNILNRKIDWPPEEILAEVSNDARDLMDRLMNLDPSKRLGANIGEQYSSGGEEIRRHPWFSDIDWDNLNEVEPSFVPAPENIEDTEYFDTRGATNHDFSTEFDDQNPQASTPPGNMFERPHDALAKVRSQVNSMKRGLMPLHIPAHVRDNRVRRSSEPLGGDDFGQFSFKNLPVLEKANKDVIQKLRNEAMQAQSRAVQSPASAVNPSPPSLEGSPVLAAPIRRALSTNKGGQRSASPSSHNIPNPSPSRGSQPSSPLVQFSAGYNHERRKTSSGSSSVSRSSSSLQPGSFFDPPRLPITLKTPSSSSSPVKPVKTPGAEIEPPSAGANPSSPRARSYTVGSNDSREFLREGLSSHQKRRSQVIDISPSSSDTEDPRQKVLLRVHRRRQSSRRLSQISLSDGPLFRPLDVLVCEDHPVSRLVMEKLLEKLRCRAIIVQNGPDAMRYALSSVKFDIIMMEFKLPQLNGADVARMIRDTKNENCNTPIVAVTGYLKELLAPHHFDALIEKPPTRAKLVEVMSKLCSWKEPPPGWTATSQAQIPVPHSSLRNESHNPDESPTSTSSGFVAILSNSSYRGSSREDSMSSNSLFTDVEGARGNVAPEDKQQQEAWHADITTRIGGLGISEANLSSEPGNTYQEGSQVDPTLEHRESAPAIMEPSVRQQPSSETTSAKRSRNLTAEPQEIGGGDFGDDEDEELGNVKVRTRSKSPRVKKPLPGSSKLSTEMLRSDSHGSVISNADSVIGPRAGPGSPTPSLSNSIIVEEITEDAASATTPPEIFPPVPGDDSRSLDDTNTEPNEEQQLRSVHTRPMPLPIVEIQESENVHVEVHAPPSDLLAPEEPHSTTVSEPSDSETKYGSSAYHTPPERTDEFDATETPPKPILIDDSKLKTTPPQNQALDSSDTITPRKAEDLHEPDPDPTPKASSYSQA